MKNLFDLTGRVALITGGNGGIGLGMAEGLAQAGADICIWGRNPDKNAAALETLSQFGPKVTAQKCDVSNEQQVIDCFAKTLADHGRVDGCFANAGLGARGTPFEEMTTQEWNEIIDVNLNGVFYTFREAARHMKARAKSGDAFGRLVGTSSLVAVSGLANGEHYAATKGALISMANALAVEYARYGVTAHSILPGWTKSEMTAPMENFDSLMSAINGRIPMRRWGEPEDFAGIATYIMSSASNYHTAETFLIDGGYNIF